MAEGPRRSTRAVGPTRPGRVVTVVLNHRHADDTMRCVSSLSKVVYENHRVIVVDNGSGTDVVASLRNGLDPTVGLVTSADNLGYGAGNNLGLAAALDSGAEFCWVVNPDVVVDPTSLSVLVRTARLHPDAGILGCRIVHGGSEPTRIWFDGGIIDWEQGGATSHLNMGDLESEHRLTGPYEVDYVTGAGMLLRSRMIDDVGLIPEDWFLYFEETTYNVLAQRSGWRTMVDTRSRLQHFKRSTGRLPEPYYIYYFVRNRYRFGIEIAGSAPEVVEEDVRAFIAAWRLRVEQARPHWLASFDRLVAEAVTDGRSLRRGMRQLDELESLAV